VLELNTGAKTEQSGNSFERGAGCKAGAPFVSSTHVSGVKDFCFEGGRPGPRLFFVSNAQVSGAKDFECGRLGLPRVLFREREFLA
jgi:hypothetical protein